jgi:hypothetical protein
MPAKFRLILIFLLWMISFRSNAQLLNLDSLDRKFTEIRDYLLYRGQDSAYIGSYTKYLALKYVAANRFNFFGVRDRNLNTSLRYRPEYGINMGVGFAYRWIGLDLLFNVGLWEDNDLKGSERFDFLIRLFTTKHFMEANITYYFGHQLDFIFGSNNFPDVPNLRPDIRVLTFGLQYLYVFNYDKFSLKAPFVQNEIQRKSAGSLVLGLSLNYYSMDADSSVVDEQLKNSFDEELHLVDVSAITPSISFGYVYSFVLKQKFFLTLGLIPGLNLAYGDSKADFRELINWHLSYKVKTMNAIGYNSRKFFASLQLVSDLNNLHLENKRDAFFTNGSLKLYVGYRFISDK